MKRIRPAVILTLCTVLLLAGCQRGSKPDISGTHIYYVNKKGTSLVKEPYEFEQKSPEEEVEYTLSKLREKQDSKDYKSAFPQNVLVENYELKEGRLDLYFTQSYTDMPPSEEVLLRASVVKTLVQIPGIDYVDFFVGGVPLTNDNGEQVGYMRAEDFVQNMGSSLHSYQLANLTLYYANKAGDKLVSEEVSVRYNSNMSVEKLIVEQLIKGTSSQDHHPTMPPDTTLLGVSVKNGICYVNFDKQFLNNPYTIDPHTVIYSLVNSIVDGGTASQVQISVNGETNINYQETVDLSKPLSRNLDIIEEGQS